MQEALKHTETARPDGREPLWQSMPHLYAARFTMRFDKATWVNTYHSASLSAYLKSLLGGNLPPGLWLHAGDEGVPFFQVDDEYTFVMYCLPSGLEPLECIMRGARQRVRGDGDARAFGPRWHCRAIADAFGDRRNVASVQQLSRLNFEDIESEARLWSLQREVYIRLLSPLQLLKPRLQRPRKGVARFCSDALDLDGALLLQRLRQSIDGLRRRLGFEVPLPAPEAELEILDCDLFWHGSEQLDKRGGQKPVYGLGGIGCCRIDGPDAGTVWLWLALGQYLGIGQRRGFGLGRYRIEGPEGERSGRFPERNASLLRSALGQGNLDAAWEAIRHNKRKAAFERELDRVTFGLPSGADQRTELSAMARRIQTGNYETPLLEGVIVDKPKGGKRALAVPPLLDRVLQRAVAQMLNRVVEPVMYAHSFGFRPGRNRMQARDLIQHLVRSGYTWFFESDIDNFFDAVDPVLIYNRLMSLLPDDPAIDQIMAWITAPVKYQGRVIERGGLPQGSPLSPLLANLVLDDFDNDLVTNGFKPVRFADDFIVPCKSHEEAQRASEVVLASLEEKGLSLNEDQSRVARFSDGLKFLGYRFLNDLAIETRKPRHRKKAEQSPHPDSWIARIPDDQHKSADKKREKTEPAPNPEGAEGVGEASRVGTLVIVSEPGCVIFTRGGQLWRQSEDSDARIIAPWPEIGALLLLGYQRFTQAALHRAMNHDVPVYFTDGFGRLRGSLYGALNDGHRLVWLKQLEDCGSVNRAIGIAQELVAARLHHQSQVLRRRGVDESTLRPFKLQQEKAMSAPSLESLRGIEGSATRDYFGILAGLLPDWAGFEGRNRRPPRDPFNALLSLGYTMLYSHTDTLIRVAGLLPTHGFYHQARGRHAALASDLMEPFRHLVEGTALAQINRRQLRDSDFRCDDKGACRMTDRGRRLFLTSLAERLAGAMTGVDGQSRTGHEHLFEQASRLARSLTEGDAAFTAARLK